MASCNESTDRGSKRQKRDPELDEVMQSVEELDAIQGELEKINDKVSAEILDIELRYNLERKPIYQRREMIIKRIPNFWQQVLENHENIGPTLSEFDREILSHLDMLRVVEREDVKSGFDVIMMFNSNKFFMNSQLKKEFHFSDDGELSVISSSIKWRNPQTPIEYPESFFVSWFDSNDQQVEIGELFKDSIWLDPFQWYMQTSAAEEDVETSLK